jgi:hypothetical protein
VFAIHTSVVVCADVARRLYYKRETLVTRVPSERYATTRILLSLVRCATMLLLGLSAAQIWLHA